MTAAGEAQVPVGQLLGTPPSRPSKWRNLLRWRDWSLPVKLAAVTVVPLLIAMTLGVLTITSQVDRADNYRRIDRLVALNGQIRVMLDGVQRERTETARLLTQGSIGGSPTLTSARTAVDTARPGLDEAVQRAVALDPRLGGAAQEVADQFGRLPGIREQVGNGKLDAVQSITEYVTIGDGLLKLDTAIVAGVSDPAIGGSPSALHDLEIAKEKASVSQALVAFGISRDGLAPSELSELRSAEVRITDQLADFRAAATQAQRQDFDSTVTGPNFDTRRRLAETALGERGAGGGTLRSISAQQWVESSAAVSARLAEVSGRVGNEVSATATRLAERSSSSVGVLAVALFAALLLAFAVVFLITRQLLRSLRVLRRSALDVAENRLPAAVRAIQENRTKDTEIEPVPVRTGDEVGEVARAFDAVHTQAVRLAVEQAAMRTGYGSVFVNLSRRSQSLVQRQLRLIERLERDEDDADQLATLFQLDHLATRMRRNNENLMVLSGAEPGRRSGQPVGLTDVVRAAVSEIEQYQRVQVQEPPAAKIVGYAASDLMRLLAELLDNATAFSAPETKVTVSSRAVSSRGTENGGILIDIVDKGIGMSKAEVAEANARLSEAASLDLVTSRRMGLFVVGRLAGRHGITVTLHGGKEITGVRATVTVPAELVTRDPSRDGPGSHADTPGALALPKRRPAANGSPLPGAVAGFAAAEPAQPHPGVNGVSRTPNGQRPPVPSVPEQPTGAEVSGTDLFAPIQGAIPAPETAAPEPPPEPPVPPAPPPKPGEAMPGGAALFGGDGPSLSQWWGASAERAAAREEPDSRLVETTPIFDGLLSAWFRDVTEKAKAEEEAENWEFAADDGWQTVRTVSSSEPTSYTAAGLPRRRRGANLLPGSAAAGPEPATAAPESAPPALPERDPEGVRGRLSSFQQGVHRARRAQAGEPVTQAPPVPDSSTVDSRNDPMVNTAEWSFGADEPMRAARAVADPAPVSYTAAGLPRRRKGEQLLPGSAAPRATLPRRERDAQDVRGRLSSFQQGIRRGRHRTVQADELPENHTTAQHMEGE